MHDLFGYAEPNPSWMMWISPLSFRMTVFQEELQNTLKSFDLGRRLNSATGIDPIAEVEGLLVTAEDVLDWRSFRVIASYGIGEENLQKRISENSSSQGAELTWKKTAQGFTTSKPGGFEWHLVGSGRVLVTGFEPERADDKAVNPGTSDEKQASLPKQGDISESSVAAWPSQVTCLTFDSTDVAGAKKEAWSLDFEKKELLDLARSFLVPDPNGHWPVALLATRDPGAVGLGFDESSARLRFKFAIVRAFFSEPLRLEGVVRFTGTEKEIEQVVLAWRSQAALFKSDPFFVLAGFGHLFDGLVLKREGSDIHFILPMTEGQAKAALLFLQLQGQALDRRLRQRAP
jgi:hypothetical protein